MDASACGTLSSTALTLQVLDSSIWGATSAAKALLEVGGVEVVLQCMSAYAGLRPMGLQILLSVASQPECELPAPMMRAMVTAAVTFFHVVLPAQRSAQLPCFGDTHGEPRHWEWAGELLQVICLREGGVDIVRQGGAAATLVEARFSPLPIVHP